jgi:hypothetical protein
VVDWVQFAARMTLAAVVVLPSGMALLWAVRTWSRSAATALQPGIDRADAAVLVGQATSSLRRRQPARQPR